MGAFFGTDSICFFSREGATRFLRREPPGVDTIAQVKGSAYQQDWTTLKSNV